MPTSDPTGGTDFNELMEDELDALDDATDHHFRPTTH